MTETTTPPGAGAPPHIHHEGEEAFYVLDGALRFQIGERTVDVAAGAFVLVPRGVAHAFTNSGPVPARYLVLYSPPRVGAYFDDLAQLAASAPGDRLSRATIAEVAARYGTEYLNVQADGSAPPRA